jgi:inosine-uridine nucleoside N-ribohydrolase
MPVKVIIDTDIGDDIDDALAIAFAMMRTELEVLAITTVYGPTHRRALLTAKLAGMVARATGMARDTIPIIAVGEGVPMAPMKPEAVAELASAVPNQYPFVDESWDCAPVAIAKADVLDVFEQAATRHPGEVTLVTIGAMTNAARLIRERPAVVKQLRGMSCMCATFLPDKVEWNIRCDPVAAKICFASDVPKAIFTWEVTRKVVLEEVEMAELRSAPGAIPRALSRLCEFWWGHKGAKRGPVIYDMSALLWLFRPEIYTVEQHGVDVITTPGAAHGQTVRAATPPCTVSTDMDAAVATRLFLDTVCGKA